MIPLPEDRVPLRAALTGASAADPGDFDPPAVRAEIVLETLFGRLGERMSLHADADYRAHYAGTPEALGVHLEWPDFEYTPETGARTRIYIPDNRLEAFAAAVQALAARAIALRVATPPPRPGRRGRGRVRRD